MVRKTGPSALRADDEADTTQRIVRPAAIPSPFG